MNSFDTARLLLLLDRKSLEHRNRIVSIRSPKFGPLMGFVPHVSSGTDRFVLDDDRFFGPHIEAL